MSEDERLDRSRQAADLALRGLAERLFMTWGDDAQELADTILRAQTGRHARRWAYDCDVADLAQAVARVQVRTAQDVAGAFRTRNGVLTKRCKRALALWEDAQIMRGCEAMGETWDEAQHEALGAALTLALEAYEGAVGEPNLVLRQMIAEGDWEPAWERLRELGADMGSSAFWRPMADAAHLLFLAAEREKYAMLARLAPPAPR